MSKTKDCQTRATNRTKGLEDYMVVCPDCHPQGITTSCLVKWVRCEEHRSRLVEPSYMNRYLH